MNKLKYLEMTLTKQKEKNQTKRISINKKKTTTMKTMRNKWISKYNKKKVEKQKSFYVMYTCNNMITDCGSSISLKLDKLSLLLLPH
jgi:predicted membrane protein